MTGHIGTLAGFGRRSLHLHHLFDVLPASLAAGIVRNSKSVGHQHMQDLLPLLGHEHDTTSFPSRATEMSGLVDHVGRDRPRHAARSDIAVGCLPIQSLCLSNAANCRSIGEASIVMNNRYVHDLFIHYC